MKIVPLLRWIEFWLHQNKTRISEAISSALKDGKGNAEARSSGGKLLLLSVKGYAPKYQEKYIRN